MHVCSHLSQESTDAILSGGESYASSQYLIEAFKDDSLALERAAFTQEKIYNPEGKTYWDYNDENSERHDMFATAMAGSAQSNLWALLNDYPWGKLGKATIVDVGGGIGGCSICSTTLEFEFELTS
jgi:hypothetical protein